eukprot:CAMPEP_0119342470 /NCGR_PEP_ID=MMETSP1333-20130426/104811_1 /TAXON_ID=418940 /ORGANISM="Scyphosphaera apsteinii, Strain RCC1455" /LENGTH=65 /DNA_ID=CAMNT_0007354695 /DNA_START=56 /DNA_END=253 /DNA_ORIENTATION=+
MPFLSPGAFPSSEPSLFVPTRRCSIALSTIAPAHISRIARAARSSIDPILKVNMSRFAIFSPLLE